jgi:hypothetical protein
MSVLAINIEEDNGRVNQTGRNCAGRYLESKAGCLRRVHQKKVRELTAKEYFYNTLYTIFDQLIRKGFIIKGFGEPMAVRGGKRKVFFRLTKEGHRALNDAFERQRRIWAGFVKETFFEETV